jgi:hypothetical protein
LILRVWGVVASAKIAGGGKDEAIVRTSGEDQGSCWGTTLSEANSIGFHLDLSRGRGFEVLGTVVVVVVVVEGIVQIIIVAACS